MVKLMSEYPTQRDRHSERIGVLEEENKESAKYVYVRVYAIDALSPDSDGALACVSRGFRLRLGFAASFFKVVQETY